MYDQQRLSRQDLPDYLNSILRKLGVRGENGKFLQLCLRDNHAVKRVSVMARQREDMQGMAQLDRELRNRIPGKLFRNKNPRSLGKLQSADLCFDRHLPGAGRTEEEIVASVLYHVMGSPRDLRVVGNPPQKDMRVQKDSHFSNSARMASGRGFRKSLDR